MKYSLHNNERGYIALLAVLIVGAAALAVGVILLTTSADSQRSVLVAQQSKQARSLAVACGQEALQVIHDDASYTGTGNLTLGQGTCTYTVTSTGVNTRKIAISATVMSVTRKVEIYATIGSSNISVTSWQDVS